MIRITDATRHTVIASFVFLFSLTANPTPVPDSFSRMIETLAAAATKGSSTVIAQWPGKALSLPREHNALPQVIHSGPIAMGDGLHASSSEIRLSDKDAVKLIIVKVEGNCLTPTDIAEKYPVNKMFDFPQPNNPDPVSYRRVDLQGTQVSFGFRGQSPGCLTDVVINPAP